MGGPSRRAHGKSLDHRRSLVGKAGAGEKGEWKGDGPRGERGGRRKEWVGAWVRGGRAHSNMPSLYSLATPAPILQQARGGDSILNIPGGCMGHSPSPEVVEEQSPLGVTSFCCKGNSGRLTQGGWAEGNP